MSDQKPWFISLFELVYDGRSVAQFIGALGLGAGASYVHLEGNTPLAPWLLVIFSMFVGLAIIRSTRKGIRWIRVVMDRPQLIIETESGSDKAMLELGHNGAPITYSAVGRVIRALDTTVTPRPQRTRFQCELQLAEGRPAAQSITLNDGEWAHIVLADQIHINKLMIRRGTFARRTEVPDSGVEVEIEIQTYPSYPIGTVTRRICVTRDASGAINAVAVGDGENLTP